MILTRQQTETIFKVCNLLDCDVNIAETISGKPYEVIFRKGRHRIVITKHSNGKWFKALWYNSTGTEARGFGEAIFFPTFEQLKPILDLIPVI